MTEITFTKDELKDRFNETTDLGEIIEHLENDFYGRNELVCKVSVNGLSLSEEDEYRLKNTMLVEIENLTLQTENAETLKFDLMKNWDQLIPSLVKLSEQLSEAIRFEGLENSYRSFVDLVEACQFLVSSLDSLKSIMTPEEKQRLTENWDNDEKKLNQLTIEIFKAFESKDEALLADLIEYELIESLQIWKAWIQRVSLDAK